MVSWRVFGWFCGGGCFGVSVGRFGFHGGVFWVSGLGFEIGLIAVVRGKVVVRSDGGALGLGTG